MYLDVIVSIFKARPIVLKKVLQTKNYLNLCE